MAGDFRGGSDSGGSVGGHALAAGGYAALPFRAEKKHGKSRLGFRGFGARERTVGKLGTS